MNEATSEVLYYPNFNPQHLEGIKQSLLLYDRVHLIAPLMTPLAGSLLTDSSGSEFSAIDNSGALGEGWSLISRTESVGLISDAEIMRERRDEFDRALADDLSSPEVLAWAAAWKQKHGGKELSWFVLPSYFEGRPPEITNPEFRIEPVSTSQFGNLLRVPFLVGMSLGLSESLWAAVDNGWTLYTDDLASEEFLMLRLHRGWKNLTEDPELRNLFTIEKDFTDRFAAAYLGSWTLKTKVPELIKSVKGKSVEDVVQLRQNSNQKEALEAFRSGLANLVANSSIWESKSFREFENEAVNIYTKSIRLAFEELDGSRLPSVSDAIKAIDVRGGVGDIIKSAPDLFVGAAVPSAAMGGILALAGIPVAPHALLALASGMTAKFTVDMIKKIGERMDKRRGAQFLTYPVNLQKQLDNSA